MRDVQASGFTETPAAIAAMLADAHVPSLLASLIHLTGSADYLDDFAPPVADFTSDDQGNMPPETQARARGLALDLLLRWRDAGYPDLPAPPPAAVRSAIDFVGGGQVPENYADFLTDELHLDGPRAATQVSINAPASAKAACPVIVIGAGMSGILAGIALKQAGLPFTIVEGRDRAGGTWWANQYPGCRVDTPNHLYSYSFEPAHEWPYRYSTQPVLQDYFERMVAKYDLAAYIRFNTRVESADWDGSNWQISVSGADGAETLSARAVISAVGQLNRPKMPDVPGIDSFAGAAFHSAQWRHDVDLAGKRVAVIGTGASAFQIVPEIAAKVAQLTVFQRTPPWLLPQSEYHAAISTGKNWTLKHFPFYARWYRFSLFWSLTEFLLPAVSRAPGWNARGSISPMNAMLRDMLEESVKVQAADRPDLLAKLIPDYAPGGKRMLVDNGVWISALKRDNVELVTDAIAGIEPAGVRLASGRLVEADVIIYATGFYASGFLQPMRITAGGRDLHASWGADPRAYLGMTVPGFPNFFTIYGPNTNIVVNGSIIFFSECSVNYILGCLKLLVDGEAKSISPRRDIHDAFNVRVDAANALMAWGEPDVSSWYKSASGRVSQNWPFALVDYWQATRAPDLADFD